MKILKIMNDYATSPEREKLNSYGGCGYYRTVKVAELLAPEHDVTVWNREWKDVAKEFDNKPEKFYEYIFKNYDLIWAHYTDNDVTFSWLRSMATHFGKKLVMDIDDNFLEVDKGNPARKKQGLDKQNRENKKAMLATNLSFCDAITVSTVPLKKKIQQHLLDVHNIDVPVYVIPNYNDVNDWKHEKVAGNKVVIGYIGGLSHNDDLSMVLPAIKQVMEKYPNVLFQMMGQMDLKTAQKIFGKWKQSIRERILLMNATKTQPEYPAYLADQPWSIGIAPLIDSPFNECKSSIKFFEYSMYKIPVVASRIYPYSKDVFGVPVIEDGETGLLCDTVEDWVNNLSKLIEDGGLRSKLGENAYNHVVENWQYKDAKRRVLEVVEQIESLKS